jgi:hypothetical protein
MFVVSVTMLLAFLADTGAPDHARIRDEVARLRRCVDEAVRRKIQRSRSVGLFNVIEHEDLVGCGAPILGLGSGRVAFEVGGRIVAKIPYNDFGVVSNRAEADYWGTAAPDVRTLLVPVIGVYDGVLFMPYVEPVPRTDAWRTIEEIRTLDTRLLDLQPANMGVHEGRVKMLDYGTLDDDVHWRRHLTERRG